MSSLNRAIADPSTKFTVSLDGMSGSSTYAHAALRMAERGVSIDAVQSSLSQQPFRYLHQDVWKTGYYDPTSRLFLGTVGGRVTTVITSATPTYINTEGRGPMRLSYDADADAAYIYLVDETSFGGVARTLPVDALASEAMINLDFDADGTLLGLEVMDASKILPTELLRGSG